MSEPDLRLTAAAAADAFAGFDKVLDTRIGDTDEFYNRITPHGPKLASPVVLMPVLAGMASGYTLQVAVEKLSYVIDGELSGGFALVAFPSVYGSSGGMTFIVNQDGKAYQKDLGSDTVNLATRMAEYNSDGSWTSVQMQ